MYYALDREALLASVGAGISYLETMRQMKRPRASLWGAKEEDLMVLILQMPKEPWIAVCLVQGCARINQQASSQNCEAHLTHRVSEKVKIPVAVFGHNLQPQRMLQKRQQMI